jgi:hypothetical protein
MLLWRPSSPPQRSQTHQQHSPAPRRRTRPPLLTARQRALPRPPWALLLCRLCGPWCGERGIPPLREPTPHRSLLPPLQMTSSLESQGERVPVARAAGTPRPAAPGAPAAGFSSSPCALPAPAPVAARRGQPLGLGAWAGRTARCPRSPSTKKRLSKPRWYVARERGREEGLLTVGASGSITNNQRSSLLCRPALRLMAHLALVAAYSRGRRSCRNRECANDVGLAASLIS